MKIGANLTVIRTYNLAISLLAGSDAVVQLLVFNPEHRTVEAAQYYQPSQQYTMLSLVMWICLRNITSSSAAISWTSKNAPPMLYISSTYFHDGVLPNFTTELTGDKRCISWCLPLDDDPNDVRLLNALCFVTLVCIFLLWLSGLLRLLTKTHQRNCTVLFHENIDNVRHVKTEY